MKFVVIAAVVLVSVSLVGCAQPPPLERGYSEHYRGYCVNHDLCDFHGGTTY
jgi:hypothetical protein